MIRYLIKLFKNNITKLINPKLNSKDLGSTVFLVTSSPKYNNQNKEIMNNDTLEMMKAAISELLEETKDGNRLLITPALCLPDNKVIIWVSPKVYEKMKKEDPKMSS